MTKILAISDVESQYLYKAIGGKIFKDIDFIISCGDLPYHYLEYMVSMSNRDLFYVRGNHAHKVEIGEKRRSKGPQGARDLHMKTIKAPGGVILAGIEGSLLYNYGPHQYSQAQMWNMVFRMIPKMCINYMRHNRFLDILVTHAPPWKINDQEDLPHQGIKAFRWLLEVFRPRYHLHGHTMDYINKEGMRTTFGDTEVINVTGYQIIEI